MTELLVREILPSTHDIACFVRELIESTAVSADAVCQYVLYSFRRCRELKRSIFGT